MGSLASSLTGVACGAGFAALETVGDAFTTLIKSGGVGGRAGAGADFVGAFAVAVVLHTLWDSQSSLIGTAVVAVASLAILGFTAHRAARVTIRA